MPGNLFYLKPARRAIGVIRGGWLFPGRRHHLTEVDDHFAAIAQASGITVSAHDLRRTYITIAESCDVAPLALKALLNHKLDDSNVTEGYVRINVHRLREPAERVVARLAELCGIVLTKEAAE
jgi:integrase